MGAVQHIGAVGKIAEEINARWEWRVSGCPHHPPPGAATAFAHGGWMDLLYYNYNIAPISLYINIKITTFL